MVTGEIPPETYPQLAIDDLHVECRTAYLNARSPWWQADFALLAMVLIAMAAGVIARAALFVSDAGAAFSRLDAAPPPSVAVGCALG
jgi:hypothetical protein